MPCNRFRDDDGRTIAIVCTRGQHKRCRVPNCDNPATKLCDYPVARKKSGTCDMPLCERCAVPQEGEDVQYCPAHAKLAPRRHEQQELFK